jgi:integrase
MGASSWVHPKDSGIRVREIVNRKGSDVFGSSFLVTVPAKLTGKGRQRKQFLTKKEAHEFADTQFKGTKRLGQEFFNLSDSEIRDAVAALELLRPRGITLLDGAREIITIHDHLKPHKLTALEAVQFAVPRMKPVGGDRTVAELVEEITTSKTNRFTNGQLRDRSLGDFKVRAEKFVADYGPTLAKDVTHQQVKDWILKFKLSTRSNKNYLAVLSEIFRYALQKKYIFSNPIADFTDDELKEIRGSDQHGTEPNILAVDRAKALIETAAGHPELDLLGAVTLGLFCGIRTQELTKLQWAHVQLDWSDLDSEKPEKSFVTIPASIAKKRRIRNVTIPRNALEWLALCPNRKGALTKNAYSSDFRKRFYKLQRLAGFGKVENGKWRSTWEENNMRHSFGSYHYALHDNSIETSRQLGHAASDHVLFSHYRALATKEQAKAYFGIVPPKTGSKIVQLASVGAALEVRAN